MGSFEHRNERHTANHLGKFFSSLTFSKSKAQQAEGCKVSELSPLQGIRK